MSMEWVASFGAFNVNIRALYYARVFLKKLGTIMAVIDESIIDLTEFIGLLYFFIFTMSVSQFAMYPEQPHFWLSFTQKYNLLFVGSEKDPYTMRPAEFVLYFVETNFLIIICLNILISVVTDKYDIVMQRIHAINLKTRAQMMHEHESLLFWRRDAGHKEYIFFAYYTEKESNSYTDNVMGDDALQGKFKQLKDQLVNNHIDVKNKIKRVEHEVSGIRDLVKQVIRDNNQRKDNLIGFGPVDNNDILSS